MRDPEVTRADVRRGLGIRRYHEPLLLAFAPVFWLLSSISPPQQRAAGFLWATLGGLALVLAVVSMVEQRRRVSLALDLVTRRRELAAAGIEHAGWKLARSTELRSYPMQASFLFLAFATSTCPSPGPRPLARALAVLINLLFGWWSLAGLLKTPLNLWSCWRGGEVTTPADILLAIDDSPRPDRAAAWRDNVRLVLTACVVLIAIVGVCALVVHFSD